VNVDGVYLAEKCMNDECDAFARYSPFPVPIYAVSGSKRLFCTNFDFASRPSHSKTAAEPIIQSINVTYYVECG
jgi:hypothetical protein